MVAHGGLVQAELTGDIALGNVLRCKGLDGHFDLRVGHGPPAFRQETASVGPYPQVRESGCRLNSIVGCRSTTDDIDCVGTPWFNAAHPAAEPPKPRKLAPATRSCLRRKGSH